MAAPRLLRWMKAVRRLVAGTTLTLAAGSAVAQPFDTSSAWDASTAASTGSFDFGPEPTDFGRHDGYRQPTYGGEQNILPGGCVDGRCPLPSRATTPSYETRRPAYDRDDLWQTPAGLDSFPVGGSPSDGYHGAPVKKEPTEAEKIDLRLSARYGNPVVERFVASTPANRFAELYLEASRLIDGRHIEPTAYQTRVDRAITNLRFAVRNPEFRRVHRLNVGPAQEQAFAQELDRFVAATPVRTSNDALRAMQGVSAIAARNLGLSASAVAAEFVYGAAESLDEYSAFTPEAPAAMPSASTGLEDSVVGIGVEIKPHEQGVIVVKPVRGGPAERGGVKPGDIITAVNGQQIGGKSMDFAVDQIGGPTGSPVLLGLVRDGRPGTISVRREKVRVYSVSDVQMLDANAGVGYVKLDKFAATSDAEMDEALWNLHRQGMQSLVLDLRGNPGGLLTTAVSLSDKFLPAGTIVSTRGRTAEDNSQESAKKAQTWKVPLVVLVDEHSASASEIFAAAIQENGRGLIVGRKSYGKGTVQTHFPLRTVSGNLKITTANFYSPNGRVMAKAGVTPDIAVPKAADDQTYVPLHADIDVRQALRVATGTEVRELAANAERNLLAGGR